MTSTRSRASTSASSLLQDVPGAFPPRRSNEQEVQEPTPSLSLYEAVHARRAEYVRPKHVRIKIGTWNVAAHKGTEKDIGGWFVGGKGVAEKLSGLNINVAEVAEQDVGKKEDAVSQEARFERKKPTLPINDPGVLPGNGDVGLYVLGLQEVVDINSATEALRPYTDPSVATKWREEMEKALPTGYRLVAEQQLLGLLLLVYASADLADEVKSVSTTSAGTGLMGYMGNKGAVTARIVIGETTRLVFVNCHLGAGADKAALDRRNWDALQITQRTRFDPIQDAMDLSQTTGEQIGDEDFAFWVGDLNYRLETIPGDDVRRLLMLHTRNEYDLKRQAQHKIDKEIENAAQTVKRKREHAASISSAESASASPRPSSDGVATDTDSTPPSTLAEEIGASEDPASLQTTISSLLQHDELAQQMKQRKAFHDGWREGPITFLPTYKYDVGSVGVFDSGEKKRAPSWCDRILYRTRRDKLAFDAKIKEEENAKRQDEQMRANGTDQAADDEEILYDYDPDADGTTLKYDYDDYDEQDERDEGIHTVMTKEGVEDELRLEYYVAHQRVLSSDHKPLDATFMLKYEAVVPDLKAKVHAEVAKDLDKAENEGRPNVTVVVDQHKNSQEEHDDTCKDFEGVSFGEVRWNQTKHRSLTIANTSRVPASFRFIERPAGDDQASGIAPGWLNMKLNDIPLTSSSSATVPVTLEPGETAVVELEIQVTDTKLVHDLNEALSVLDDVLVLRVEGGRDHFIPVRAKWLETILGRSIDKLIRIPEGGIRKLQNQRPDKSSKKTSSRPSSGTASPVVNEPVRCSAPRELFRLTEAIEESATRVVAEWDMTSSDSEIAPWKLFAGWPFDEHCWTEISSLEWDSAMSDLCNALDTDQSVEASLPQELPRIQRLYVLSSFLLTFLASLSDGIIDEDLWTRIDLYLMDLEKHKHHPTNEEQRTAIHEILSQSPSHSISFILVTSMLDRLSQEIASTQTIDEEPPLSPKFGKAADTLRRVTGTFAKLSVASRREQACTAWARIFAKLITRAPTDGVKKHHTLHERRMMELIEVFLRKDEPG